MQGVEEGREPFIKERLQCVLKEGWGAAVVSKLVVTCTLSPLQHSFQRPTLQFAEIPLTVQGPRGAGIIMPT